MDNIIIAAFGGRKDIKLSPRYRYDFGQILRIAGITGLPETYEAQFSNAGATTAYRVIASGTDISIPDELFETGKDIVVHIVVHNAATDGTTVYRILIPIKDRPRPENYTPTPTEAGLVEQAIVLLNREIADIENAHNNALAAQAAQDAAESAQSAAEASAANASTSEQNAAQSAAGAAQSASDAQNSLDAAIAARDRAEMAQLMAERHSIGMWLEGTTLKFVTPREG